MTGTETKKLLAETLVIVDVDNTIYPYSQAVTHAVRRIQNSDFNTPYEAPTSWDLIKAWGVKGLTSEELALAHFVLMSTPEIHAANPMTGAKEALALVRERGVRVQIQTYRATFTARLSETFHANYERVLERCSDITNEWLRTHFGFHPNQIIQANEFETPKGRAHINKGAGCVLFIEDSPRVIRALIEVGERVIMPQNEYNEHLLNEYDVNVLTSFKKWADAPDAIIYAVIRNWFVESGKRTQLKSHTSH